MTVGLAEACGYVELGRRACEQLKRLAESEDWPQLEWDEPGLQVLSRPSAEFPDAKEDMLMLVTTLNVSCLRRVLPS